MKDQKEWKGYLTADDSEEAEDDHDTGPDGDQLAEAGEVVLRVLVVFCLYPARAVGPRPQAEDVLRRVDRSRHADTDAAGKVDEEDVLDDAPGECATAEAATELLGDAGAPPAPALPAAAEPDGLGDDGGAVEQQDHDIPVPALDHVPRLGELERVPEGGAVGRCGPERIRGRVHVALEAGSGQEDEAVGFVGSRERGREGGLLPRVLVREEQPRHDEDARYADDADGGEPGVLPVVSHDCDRHEMRSTSK